MRARIGRVVWFDIYGEEDWHEGNPARVVKLEAIGRITKERAEGKTFIVVSPHNSLADKQKFYDLKIPKGNVIRIDYWDESGKLPDTT
jgi:hypothetical protein